MITFYSMMAFSFVIFSMIRRGNYQIYVHPFVGTTEFVAFSPLFIRPRRILQDIHTVALEKCG
jgi:hypothetical protein